ncbi:MAG TPA: alpha-2-macroglobulin family protein [Candidatus Desulfaltia sp.]|nr:alpha-2-macroglobulin family protein [Candidatus Desulfaltia sp.]
MDNRNVNPGHPIGRERRRGFFWLRALPVLLVAPLILLAATTLYKVESSPSIRDLPNPSFSSFDDNAQQKLDRKGIDQLIDEQKFEEATKEAARLREEAKGAGDDAAWAWALIKEVQLRTALHGYETSVRFLKDEPWPQSPVQRDMLELFFADSLETYYAAYSWEINRRERVESKGPVDLKAWTKEQIFAEAWSSLLKVWEDRGRLQDLKAGNFPEFWHAGDYPPEIRDTLRDAVVYLMARVLVDTRSWTPRQSNETFLLDLENLVGEPAADKSVSDTLHSPSAHPLEKLNALLGDHETWCRSSSRPEAALEARLERLQALHSSFTQEEDRALIRSRLSEVLPKYRKYPWWAMGQAVLAEFTKAEGAADALVDARKVAKAGADAYPDSPGGRRCLHLVKSIEASGYSVDIMKTDAPGKRSIQVTHRNLDRLFFRAFPVDILERVRTSKDYNILPDWREAQTILGKEEPVAEWETALPQTPDFRDHRTFVDVPEDIAPGLYLVAASARRDFARQKNHLQALPIILADIVLLKRDDPRGGAEALVLSGKTGNPVAGAEVYLYAFDWKRGHTLIETLVTDREGHVRFEPRKQSSGPFFLVAKKGPDIVLESSYLYLYARTRPEAISRSLIYTDRSIYRPGQKIYWKILAYKGRQDLGRFQPAANASAAVWLVDINGQRVAEAVRTTNEFGTASGEFVIPAAGRPLGAWRLQATPEGQAMVRVEEYKRPTFEVTFKDPDKPLRLNRPATLTGEARYYFGLPVASGTAVWQVRRSPVYPRWWWWDSGGGQTQIIAGGRSALKEDGTFEVSFTPRADERKDGPGSGLTYSYTLSVDVTDEGGETRSAGRSFRLGFVSVEGRIAAASGFFRADAPCGFTITRTDLNGTPKPGTGTWRVVRLVQPEATLLPADQPLPESELDKNSKAYRTPGDRLRPRWESAPSPESILFLWKEGAEAAKGVVEHDQEGEAEISILDLDAGAFRLLYETKDDFGSVCRERLDFLVAEKHASARLPLLLVAEKATVSVGQTARLLVHSGWNGQPLLYEMFKGGELWERRWAEAGKDKGVVEIPVTEKLRGGFGVRITTLRDHQFISQAANIFVPWDNKQLDLSFSSFRDKLTPGGRETWRVTVKTPSGEPAVQGAAELLAYMYDRSLDIFARHLPPQVLNIYPSQAGAPVWRASLGQAPRVYSEEFGWVSIPSFPIFMPAYLVELDRYGVGGPGGRRYAVVGGVRKEMALPQASRLREGLEEAPNELAADKAQAKDEEAKAGQEPPTQEAVPLRSKFDETAFWQPHLLTGPDGTATVEFRVPDSVTGWRVFVHAVTRELMGGMLQKEARSVKELMVRPYLPRFFREGDRAELRVAVNNAGEESLTGSVALEIFDPFTNENLAPAFGLPARVPERPFTVKAGGGEAVTFALAAPARVGTVAFKVTARAGGFSDGELRPLPVLPGRMHLVQSRFVTLKEGGSRELKFPDLARDDDPTRINEQLVVTVDAQLFYGLLEALPYLVNYPYECTEQTLNRFVSTGILTSLYDKYPQVARMAEALSKRETLYETFDAADPNRKMSMEETPWLVTARGGEDAGYGVEKVLDPRIAKAQREASLAKLLKAQTSLGAFPWWPGGPPSPYMTLYIVYGFSKALEFGVEVPKDPIVRAFDYLHRHYIDEVVRRLLALDTGWEFVTFLNYTLSNFPDSSWTGDVFTDEERKQMLDFSFRHWKRHSPYLKGYLALTLKRAERLKDAALVWDSVMDSAKTTPDEGTSWAPEDRGWLWYNDTIETHAFALRTLMELEPKDIRSEGLVQWLFLNKKLNHWKSTRATAEVIYSVAYFLNKTGALGVRESIKVDACRTQTTFVFEPDAYTGKKNQVVIPGEKVSPECATVRVQKEGKGIAFASATWHFSTEKMPEKGEGDLFAVERSYFLRTKRGDEVVLNPLTEGAPLAVGDELEVHLSIRARHPAEYVHLRDPRPSGCEPVTLTSGYKWDLGIARYEEVRDSGTNFFVEWLPQGEYSLKHRLRCAMAGTFKAAPATLQSMYAPEFAAYSAGHVLRIE